MYEVTCVVKALYATVANSQTKYIPGIMLKGLSIRSSAIVDSTANTEWIIDTAEAEIKDMGIDLRWDGQGNEFHTPKAWVIKPEL